MNSNEQSIFGRTLLGIKTLELRHISKLARPQQSVGIDDVHAEISLMRFRFGRMLYALHIMRLIGTM